MQNQHTGEIPKDRISKPPTFSAVGIDFTGPIYIRRTSQKTIGKAQPSFKEIMITLLEIENIFNHRLLTYARNDKRETVPLTPAQFLFSVQMNNYPCNLS